MVAVPDFRDNDKPEEKVDPKVAESLARDASAGAGITAGDLAGRFDGNVGDAAKILGGLAITSDKDGAIKEAQDPRVRSAMEKSAQIANMTTGECESALGMEKITVANLESRVNGTRNTMELADQKQQADKLLEANTYFANFA